MNKSKKNYLYNKYMKQKIYYVNLSNAYTNILIFFLFVGIFWIYMVIDINNNNNNNRLNSLI